MIKAVITPKLKIGILMRASWNYKAVGTSFLVGLWVITCIAKFHFNGLIFGFDYGVYQPDGVHYTFKTLTLLGESPLDAAHKVSDWYQTHSFKMRDIDPLGILPENNGGYHLTKTRITYPVLSVPFVYFWGIPGMLAIPALSLLAFMLLPLLFSNDRRKFTISCVAVFVLSISPTVQRWMLVNCTDSLLVGLFSLYFIFCLRSRIQTRFILAIDLLFMVLTTFTRFSLPFWMGISFVLFLERKYLRSMFMIFTSSLLSLPTIFAGGSSAISPANEDGAFYSKVLSIPLNLVRVLFYEVGELGALDRGLLACLGLGLIISWKTRKELYSRLYFAFLFAGVLIGAINGTIGVNFRYQMPLLIPLLLVLSNSTRDDLITK